MSVPGILPEYAGLRVNTTLRFYHEILGLDALHYGLFENDPLTMDGLKKAQQRYADHLLGCFPANIKSVLDAGAGTGATSEFLKSRGYDVEALSPDPYQKHVFEKKRSVRFHLARFQDFLPKKKYDLVLMCESAQHIPMEGLFSNARRCAPGGYLLINDAFITHPDSSILSKSGHHLENFIKKARKQGYELLKEEDITDQVAVTLDLAKNWMERFVIPGMELLGSSLQQTSPWRYRLLRWLMHGKIKAFNDQQILLDSAHFKRVKRYKLLLFRVPQ